MENSTAINLKKFEGKNGDWEGIFPKFSVFLNPGFYYNSQQATNELWFECAAAEQSLVVKWLRDVHKIYIEFATTTDLKWDYRIDKLREGVGFAGFFANLDSFDTYEDAELEGIQEAIKYLKDESTS